MQFSVAVKVLVPTVTIVPLSVICELPPVVAPVNLMTLFVLPEMFAEPAGPAGRSRRWDLADL